MSTETGDIRPMNPLSDATRDNDIRVELEQAFSAAGIDPYGPTIRGRVILGHYAAIVIGPLGTIHLTRWEHYYIASGPVPALVAEFLYDHPVGKASVRAAGHAGRVDPRDWYSNLSYLLHPVPFIDTYHIDTQEGLDLFIKAVTGGIPEMWGSKGVIVDGETGGSGNQPSVANDFVALDR